MQLHELKLNHKSKSKRRVGRGGKRGTYSGKGSKGQKSRAGARIRPGFRGGDNPLWKLFPKQRGATKRVDVKHATFRLKRHKPSVLNLGKIDTHFKDGDSITPKLLIKTGLVSSTKHGVKLLSQGALTKKLKFSGLKFSKSATIKIEKSGSTIVGDKQ